MSAQQFIATMREKNLAILAEVPGFVPLTVLEYLADCAKSLPADLEHLAKGDCFNRLPRRYTHMYGGGQMIVKTKQTNMSADDKARLKEKLVPLTIDYLLTAQHASYTAFVAQLKALNINATIMLTPEEVKIVYHLDQPFAGAPVIRQDPTWSKRVITRS